MPMVYRHSHTNYSISKILYIVALFTKQDKWTIGKYVMEVMRPFQCGTIWMSKRHSVTLNHLITLYNDICDILHGLPRALDTLMTPWNEALCLAGGVT
jgi:hypothetical protein